MSELVFDLLWMVLAMVAGVYVGYRVGFVAGREEAHREEHERKGWRVIADNFSRNPNLSQDQRDRLIRWCRAEEEYIKRKST